MFEKIKQSSVVLMVVIIFVKLIGMLRDIVLANYFGTSDISDAYLIAISVPTFLFYFIGHALSTAYLPMFNKIRTEQSSEAALDYSNNLMCISFVFCAVFSAALFLFPEVFVKIFAAGFNDNTLKITSTFIRTGALSIFLMTALNIFSSYLQAHNNFILPASVSLPRNLVLIFSVVVAYYFGIWYLGLGILVAYFAEVTLLVPSLIKNKYKFKLKINFKSPEIKETLFLVLPIFIGVAVNQINNVIDRSVASTIIEGGISALSYASIINNAVQEVLVTGVITILFAKCSTWVAEGKYELVKNKLSETIKVFSFLIIPATFGIISLSTLVVKLILCRGSFNEFSLKLTSGALICYTSGLLFHALRDTLIKVYYAYKETKFATVSSIIAIAVNVVLNLILSRFWGINGLAIASSISVTVQCIILYIYLHKKIGDFGLSSQIIEFIKSTVAGIIMFIGVKVLSELMLANNFSEIIVLILSVIFGFVLYVLLSFIFKSSTLFNFIDFAAEKIKIIKSR